jgi:hypothetical protein
MKNTIKLAESLAIGMVIGGAAWAIASAKMKSKPDTKQKLTKAVKSACDFIDGLC